MAFQLPSHAIDANVLKKRA